MQPDARHVRGRGSNRRNGLEEQNGGGENTYDCDSESHSNPWSRAEARETCSHDGSKVGQKREVEAERQGGREGRWPALHAWE